MVLSTDFWGLEIPYSICFFLCLIHLFVSSCRFATRTFIVCLYSS